MNKVSLLVKNYFRMFFTRILRSKHLSSKNIILVAVLGICCMVLPVMISVLSYTTIVASIKINAPTLAISSFTMTACMFLLMLVVTESSPSKKNNDEELLLSLPITKRQIIMAKILYYFIFDFVVILLLLFPSYIIYYILVKGTSFFLLVRALIFILEVTLIACGISNLISLFIVRISKKFKHSSIFQSIISTFLMILFIVLYTIFSVVSQDVSSSQNIYDIKIFSMITDFIAKGKLSGIIIISLITLIVFFLSVYLKAYFLGKNNSNYKSNNQTIVYNESSVKKSLYIRELNKYFSIPIYVINTIFGPLLMLMIVIIVSVMGKEHFINLIVSVLALGYEEGFDYLATLNTITKYFNIGFIAMMSLTLSFSTTTASAISIEGKELWILKAHPVDYKDVFLSKVFVNLTVTLIPLLIGGAILSFVIDLFYLPFLIIIPTIIVINSSLLGLYANLLFPKFDWTSEQEVVKQGIAVLVSMLFSVLSIIIPVIIIFILGINKELMILITFISILLIITLCSFLLLRLHGKKLYYHL